MKHTRLFGAATLRIAMGCCLLALGGGPGLAAALFVAQPGKMTRYELPGYTLVTVDNSQLRRDMTKLPRLKRALELSLGIDVKPTGIPTRVYVVENSIWDRYMEPSYGIPGEFIPTRFVNYIVANSVRLDRGELFHEHTHLYLYNQMPGVYPLWFDDGLAVFMARAQFTETEAQFFPTRRGDAGGWIPTARLLRVTRTSPEYLSEKELYSFHFQSYAMVYRALVDEPEFGKRVFQYLEEFNNLRPPDEAEKALGESLEDLDFKMHAYLNTSGKKRVSLKLDGVKDLELPPGTPVSRLDSLLEIATVCLDGGLHLDMVHELLDAADGEPGGNPRAMPLRMRLAARLKDDAKLEELYGILNKESDARVARAAGLALFERVQTLDEQSSARRTDLMTRSFDLLNRSLATQADDPEAVWAFAMLSADLKRDLDVALQRLVPMFDRLPSNPDMAHAAGKVLYARGDQNVMPYLTAVLRYAHTIEQKRWALERINALRAKAAAPRDAPAQ